MPPAPLPSAPAFPWPPPQGCQCFKGKKVWISTGYFISFFCFVLFLFVFFPGNPDYRPSKMFWLEKSGVCLDSCVDFFLLQIRVKTDFCQIKSGNPWLNLIEIFWKSNILGEGKGNLSRIAHLSPINCIKTWAHREQYLWKVWF